MIQTTISTYELTEELMRRPGVKSLTVEPYEEIKIQTGREEFTVQGPAIILINQD